MRRRELVAGGALALGGCVSVGAAPTHRQPIIIAHRGASGERPEHTLSAYRLAIEEGADYIEPDLVITKDGVLVCRHENEISGTTDVAARGEFAARRTAKIVDGQRVDGWFVEDFTLAELKTLRCKERLPQLRPQNTRYDGQDEIPTFAEALALAMASPRTGIYPELKHPTFLRTSGFDLTEAFAGFVQAHGGQAAADRMFVQCFETAPLISLAMMSSLRWSLIQLIAADAGPWDRRELTPAAMTSNDGLRDIARYARGIGVEKTMIVPRDASQRSQPPTDLIARAHAAALQVHAWTFRAENYFLPLELRRGDNPAASGDLSAELRQFYDAGIDGVFCDYPALALAAR